MNYDKAAHQFGEWGRYFKPFIESAEFDNIFLQIKQRVKSGVKVFPEAANVFRCFKETPPDNLKVIFCSFAPYHTRIDNIVVADGLAFSCSNTGQKYGLQPSLYTIYDAIEKTYCDGFNLNMQQEPDLSYWSHQGILLYNTGLTVEENKAGSMQEIWKPFNKFFWEQVINQYFRGLPIIFFGQVAAKSEKLLTPLLHHSLIVEHPASTSYKGPGTEWKYNDLFRWVDNILLQNNGDKIQWYKEARTIEDCPF